MGKKLRGNSGLISWQAVTASSGVSLAKMTGEAFKCFATIAGRRVKKVRESFKAMTHTIATDAASNELLASEICCGDYSLSTRAVTPNAVDVVRDRSHGVRRLGSRPFASVAKLQFVTNIFFRGRGSPAQLIQRSPELRREFLPFIASFGTSAKIRNMRAAKHRFESWSKPAGRMSIMCRAFMVFTRLVL